MQSRVSETLDPMSDTLLNSDRHPMEDTTASAIQTSLRFLRVLRFRWSYVAVALAISCLLGTVYYFTTTRYYKATASLLITQTNPEFWKFSGASSGPPKTLISTFEQLFSSAVILDGAIERLQRKTTDVQLDFTGLAPDKWRDVIRRHLVARAIRNTNIVELTYLSKSPRAGQAVVAAIVESYLDFIEKTHTDDSVKNLAILEERRKSTETKLEQQKQHLLGLKRRIKDFGARDRAMHPEVQRVIQLNETYIEVRKKRVHLEASLTAVREAIRSGKDLRQHLMNLQPVVGDRLISGTLGLNTQTTQMINEMERKIIEDRAKMEQFRAHLGPSHPHMIRLRRALELADTHRQEYQKKVNAHLNELQQRELGPLLLSMLEEQLVETWEHEKRLLKEYSVNEAVALRLNDEMTELTIAERDVEWLYNHHDMLLDQIANIDMGQHRSHVHVSVVSEPVATGKPVSPRLAFIGLLCVMVGLGSGGGLVYVLDVLDDRFRSPEEIKDQLGVPVLAMIRELTVPVDTGTGSVQVFSAPDAVESEAFRTLRTTLSFNDHDSDCIAITSSEPGDGKTTILANLGAAWAQSGKKTLLIDADMRRPGLTKLFEMRGSRGLSDLLRGDRDVTSLCGELVQPTQIPNLSILTCGPRPLDPVELLCGSRMVDLITWAQTHYDQVLVDCPPIMAASDAVIVGNLVEGMVLVVQPEKNHRRLVLRSTENLIGMGVDLIGIVANRIGDVNGNGYCGYGYGYADDESEEGALDTNNESGNVSHSASDSDGWIKPRRAA